MKFGSSPHTRGTLSVFRRTVWAVRFIPAYAGNARPGRQAGSRLPVHPRIRGERWRPGGRDRRHHGSSPHTRGTRGWRRPADSDGRFIPAYAGNAHMLKLMECESPVHPRIRGERFRCTFSSRNSCGSSPHTRGTLDPGRRAPGRHRFIPAYAGNAAVSVGLDAARSVHPRIRGERAHGRCSILGQPRFIPAYAGNAYPST